LFDLEAVAGLERCAGAAGEPNRLDREPREFHAQVHAGTSSGARTEPRPQSLICGTGHGGRGVRTLGSLRRTSDTHHVAIARTYTGDHRGAESLYVSLTERTADDPLVWVGLGGAALRAGDSVQTARALARLNAYAPDGREARAIRKHLRIFPEVWPSTREVVGGEAGGTRR